MGKHGDGKGPQDKELDISGVVHSPDQNRTATGEHADTADGKDGNE